MLFNSQLLKTILEGFSKSLCAHSCNVCYLSIKVAEQAGFDKQQIRTLAVGALLHDIGKSCIDEGIINKPGKLTQEEFSVVRQHTSLGATIINNFENCNDYLPIILYHHERWDGNGYYGLQGENIPELAGIVSVADAFDAMTSPRPYQKIKTITEALRELQNHKGLQFSPHLVDVFEISVLNIIKDINTVDFYEEISCLIDE